MKAGEIYGFVGWIGSMLFYGMYLLWAIVPDKYLVKLGINYYPSKQWALIIPSFICITVGLNMLTTLNPDNICNIEDNYSRFAQKQDLQQLNEGLPELFDLPITVVNNALFYQKDIIKQFNPNNNDKQ